MRKPKQDFEIHQIPFLDIIITVVKDANDTFWVPIKWLCQTIGLSVGQTRRKIADAHDQRIISRGTKMLPIPTSGGTQDMLCLEITYVPFWIAALHITPAMERETPELAERIANYQQQLTVEPHLLEIQPGHRNKQKYEGVTKAITERPMVFTLEFLQSNGRDISSAQLFAAVIIPKLQWDLAPFGFLYDLYRAWCVKEHIAKPYRKTKFNTEIVKLADTGEIKGWTCPGRKSPIRPSNRMNKPEPLIAEYNLTNWQNFKIAATYKGLQRL